MKPVLYSKRTGCGQCIAAKRDLDSRGIDYELRYAEDHLDLLTSMGVKQMPLLVVGEMNYSGYRPDVISQL
ncbi:glutaredoxin domain-containing protein [Brevibacterium casei]|uniref:glutaredoxin domain-containing protein n=1 Tax=Brevibacterium casei TaxID=33889 RepID=UPI003F7D5941